LEYQKNKKVKLIRKGLIDYKECWDFQEELFKHSIDLKIENRKENTFNKTDNFLIFCQHPPVYTLGKSGKPEHLLLTESELSEKGIQYYPINRGGDITFHGPGQLVGYPILDLDNFFTDIHKYLRYLEQAIIDTLAEYSVPSDRIEGLTGVWIDHDKPGKERKICALGVKTSRWVTMHGFAFNINTDLDYFKNIIPCGIDDKAVTSLEKEVGKKMDFDEVSAKVLKNLVNVFEMEIVR
jgi:lipoyl(octanoyl) transferase